MSKKEPKILLVIPAFNEEDSILSTLKCINDFNSDSNTKYKYDYIVINDGSKDSTGKILDGNNIKHVDLLMNLGIGGAVQTGYKYAYQNDYDIAIQFDADGQHDINYVEKIIEPIINNNINMVIGSRFIDKKTSDFQSSKLRRLGIKIIGSCIELKTHKKVYDTTSGFRALDKNLIRFFNDSYPVEYPEPISIVEALKHGYSLEEVPVSMNERTGGVSSIRAWKSAYYMINVILSILCTGRRR